MAEKPIPVTEEPDFFGNCCTVGVIGSHDFALYVHQRVYQQLETFSAESTAKERACILLGEWYCHGKKEWLVISHMLPATQTIATAESVTFTAQTWQEIHKQRNACFGDKKIVGWHHTHPGYGVELSAGDRFIHENFFSSPFQVAYVIDPLQNRRCFYGWKNHTLQPLSGYYVYSE